MSLSFALSVHEFCAVLWIVKVFGHPVYYDNEKDPVSNLSGKELKT